MQLLFQLQVDGTFGKLKKFLETKGSVNCSKREAQTPLNPQKTEFQCNVEERPDIRITEPWNTRLEGDLYDHLVQPFLAKAQSRRGGPASCPASS